jgi:hypothetical protein
MARAGAAREAAHAAELVARHGRSLANARPGARPRCGPKGRDRPGDAPCRFSRPDAAFPRRSTAHRPRQACSCCGCAEPREQAACTSRGRGGAAGTNGGQRCGARHNAARLQHAGERRGQGRAEPSCLRVLGRAPGRASPAEVPQFTGPWASRAAAAPRARCCGTQSRSTSQNVADLGLGHQAARLLRPAVSVAPAGLCCAALAALPCRSMNVFSLAQEGRGALGGEGGED